MVVRLSLLISIQSIVSVSGRISPHNFENSLADHNFERNLEEQLKNERILDEPPCRASMKNSGNKKDDRKKGKLKTQGEALR